MELDDYLRTIRARWLVVVVAGMIGALVALGWGMLQPKVYLATSSAIVTTGFSSSLDDAISGDDFAKSRVRSYVDIAQSREVAEQAAQILEVETSASDLVDNVRVSNPEDTAVLRVVAEGGTPEEARDLADAWVGAMTQVVAQIERGDTVVQLQAVDSASLPEAPASPNLKLIVGVGLLVGLTAGVVFARFRAQRDRRLRTAGDVEKVFAVPVLGSLHYDAEIARRGLRAAPDDFAMREAVRQARTNLQYVDIDNPPRVIIVTSSTPGEGKSTVAVKLAEAIADSGRTVVLVDADLRRPTVAAKLDLVEGVGLTDVLVGRAQVEDVVQSYGASGRFNVLSAGPVPPNPSELLGTDMMHELLYAFPEDWIVLVDTPPLVPVTDAAILAARTDGAIVVVRSGMTRSDILDKALSSLDRVNGRALGVVVNGVPRSLIAGPYGYGYAYSYEPHDGEAAPEGPSLVNRLRGRSRAAGKGGDAEDDAPGLPEESAVPLGAARADDDPTVDDAAADLETVDDVVDDDVVEDGPDDDRPEDADADPDDEPKDGSASADPDGEPEGIDAEHEDADAVIEASADDATVTGTEPAPASEPEPEGLKRTPKRPALRRKKPRVARPVARTHESLDDGEASDGEHPPLDDADLEPASTGGRGGGQRAGRD